MSKERPATRKSKKPTVEEIKLASNYLTDNIAEEVFDETTDHVSEEVYQLLKFSGMYQQDDRDQRKARRQAGLGKAYSFMLRSRAPGGRLSAAQFLIHDKLADEVGNGTMRLTTRQGIQLHGILKGNIKKTIETLHSEMLTSVAACGDINRNVMACPAPEVSRRQSLLQEITDEINARLLPQGGGYYQVWLDGEKLPTPEFPDPVAKIDDVEPIYGKTYLPRKFKIGIAYPEDNCIEVFTQDIGIIPVMDEEVLLGFNLVIGGGMGMSHTVKETSPLLAKELGFVSREQLLRVVEGIVSVQRDYGNREDRKFARMKWLVEERGVAWFKAELEARLGFEIGEWAQIAEFKYDDHLGWREQGDGKYYLGIYVENGRVKDEGSYRMRSLLRELLTRYPHEVRITGQQNLLLTNLEAEDEDAIAELFLEYGVPLVEEITPLRRNAMACPALPTCGLAVAESERFLPSFLGELEGLMTELGLGDETIALRMTGCPNGCARPFTAELSFVGRSLNAYNVYVGGSAAGTRLVEAYAEMVKGEALLETLKPLLQYWKDARHAGEAFGDFCNRIGVKTLQERTQEPVLA